MTTALRCRYNLDARCQPDLRDQLLALEVASRGYRERAERAEETMLLAVWRADRAEAQNRAAWSVARDMVSDCEAGHADPMEVRPYAQDILRALGAEDVSHARPVAACETAEGLRTPTEGAPAERGSGSIVSAAHYGRMA